MLKYSLTTTAYSLCPPPESPSISLMGLGYTLSHHFHRPSERNACQHALPACHKEQPVRVDHVPDAYSVSVKATQLCSAVLRMHAPNWGTSGRSMSSCRAGSTSFLSLTMKSWPSSVCATSSCHSCIAAKQIAVCKKAERFIPFSTLQDDRRLCVQSSACLAIILHRILKSLACVPA